MKDIDIYKNIVVIATFIWRSFTWIYFLGIAFLEVYKIFSFRKKNGAIIWKQKPDILQAIALMIFPILIIFIIFYISLSSRSISYTLLIVAFFILIPILSYSLRKVYFGIYESRIVGDQFVSDWRQIKNIIFDDEKIRIIDKTRGAIEFLMDIQTIEKVRPKIEKRYVKERQVFSK